MYRAATVRLTAAIFYVDWNLLLAHSVRLFREYFTVLISFKISMLLLAKKRMFAHCNKERSSSLCFPFRVNLGIPTSLGKDQKSRRKAHTAYAIQAFINILYLFGHFACSYSLVLLEGCCCGAGAA